MEKRDKELEKMRRLIKKAGALDREFQNKWLGSDAEDRVKKYVGMRFKHLFSWLLE